MANTPDNRKTKRSPVTLRIKFKSANLEQFIERYAVDVSQGGIFIRTKEPLPVGTTMRFEFQLRDESPLITGEGTVVWIREQNASQAGVAPGMGVRFDRLTEPSQGVLDEILAYKAARGAGGVTTALGDMPTRVVSAGPHRDGPGAPMPFAGEGVPEEAFEQATKVHSLEELAELSARPDPADPGKRSAGGAAAPRNPAGFDPVGDYAESDDDKTKVYPALARPGGRMAGPDLDLGASGTTQRLPPAPGTGADVELGHAGYDEDDDDSELPFDTRDVELGLAGPTGELAHERVGRSDEVELGHAGVTQPMASRRPASRASAAAPARVQGQAPARVIPLGDLGDLGESGASDPLSDVPLPEAGHFDLGQAGPTMQLKAERLGRDAQLELGAAGSNEDAEVITAALPAVPSKDKAQRPIQPAAIASAVAAARAPASPDPEASEETQERASGVDELAARRPGWQASEPPAASAAPAADDEVTDDDERVETTALPAAAAPQALAEERAARSGPVLRVSTRNGTEKVPVEKGLPAALLIAVAALILLVGAGALYLFTRDRNLPGPETAEVPAPPTDPAASPDTPPVPDQPSANPGDTAAAAAAPDAAAAAAVGEPEIEPEIEIEPEPEIEIEPDQPAVPVETVQLEVRSVPPGATATVIDSGESGPTPMKFALDKSKKHRVRVSLPGHVSQEIELDPARRQPARVTLAPLPWILRFESTPPKAFVYVDGRRAVGETPNELQLPPGWEKKRQLKVSFRLPHHEKLDIVVQPAFEAEGEAMVQTVRGTLVPGEPAPHRPAPSKPASQPAPSKPADQPAPGGQATPPAGGEESGSGAAEPAPAPAEPPKADPPPAPAGQSADPPAQHP